MKNFARILSLTLVAVMLVATLASCSSITGTYSAEIDVALVKTVVTYEFGMFGKVTMSVKTTSILGNVETKTYEGKYSIATNEDETQEITFEFESEDDEAETYGGTKTLVVDKENGTIKIGLVTYTKA